MSVALKDQLVDIVEGARIRFSDLLPSEWNELNRALTSDISPVPGPLRYDYTPYNREIVDCLSPNHPARIITVMKGLQIGVSTTVIEAGIVWIISQEPGPIMFLSGHPDLAEEAMNKKIDQAIDSCGLRPLIKPSTLRKRNQRTGDTSKGKEFPGGSLVAGSASNHKLLRQRSIRYGFFDDFESAKKSTKQSGDTRRLAEGRFAAYYNSMKAYYISTPELEELSNIEPAYMLGDQRKYHVTCPCCKKEITFEWEIGLDGTSDHEKAGMTWKLDDKGKLISGSVRYRCQKCGGYFDDSKKHDMVRSGRWIATAEPSEVGYYSYHISSLYAPPGMYDWEHYVRQYLEANPPGGDRKEDLHKVFVNTVLGFTYKHVDKQVKPDTIQRNVRDYKIGIIPEEISVKDGNGKIVILTCACDLNGVEIDARVDYEIVAWSESGSSYSIRHGSIGTFIPREGAMKKKVDRERWTYEHNRTRSVWPALEKVLNEVFVTDNGRKMKIAMAGVDCGHYTVHAYNFIDKTALNVIGLKGDKEGQYRKINQDLPIFKPAKERAKLHLLDVNYIKDMLAETINLHWDQTTGEPQPPEFMNFPQPSDGMYLYTNYFEHFEAEHRTIESKDGQGHASRWVKKPGQKPNHFWDVNVYNIALKYIFATLALKQTEQKRGTWSDFVRAVQEETKKQSRNW